MNVNRSVQEAEERLVILEHAKKFTFSLYHEIPFIFSLCNIGHQIISMHITLLCTLSILLFCTCFGYNTLSVGSPPPVSSQWRHVSGGEVLQGGTQSPCSWWSTSHQQAQNSKTLWYSSIIPNARDKLTLRYVCWYKSGIRSVVLSINQSLILVQTFPIQSKSTQPHTYYVVLK